MRVRSLVRLAGKATGPEDRGISFRGTDGAKGDCIFECRHEWYPQSFPDVIVR